MIPFPSGRKAYERSRAARKHTQKARVLKGPPAAHRHLQLVQAPRERDPDRPRTRADCIDLPRPCPYVSCRHHLYLDVNRKTGSIKLNRPELEVEDLQDSCSLDVADEGGTTMESVAALMNLTRERVRQIEDNAIRQITPELERWAEENEE